MRSEAATLQHDVESVERHRVIIAENDAVMSGRSLDRTIVDLTSSDHVYPRLIAYSLASKPITFVGTRRVAKLKPRQRDHLPQTQHTHILI